MYIRTLSKAHQIIYFTFLPFNQRFIPRFTMLNKTKRFKQKHVVAYNAPQGRKKKRISTRRSISMMRNLTNVRGLKKFHCKKKTTDSHLNNKTKHSKRKTKDSKTQLHVGRDLLTMYVPNATLLLPTPPPALLLFEGSEGAAEVGEESNKDDDDEDDDDDDLSLSMLVDSLRFTSPTVSI